MWLLLLLLSLMFNEPFFKKQKTLSHRLGFFKKSMTHTSWNYRTHIDERRLATHRGSEIWKYRCLDVEVPALVRCNNNMFGLVESIGSIRDEISSHCLPCDTIVLHLSGVV